MKFGKARFALGLSLVCALWASPVIAQTYDSYDNGGYSGGYDNGPAGSPVFSGDAAGTEVRLQQFESQISTLTGKIEEQDNRIRQLQEQLEKANADMALRLEDLEKGRGGSGGGAPAYPSAIPPTEERGNLENGDRTENGNGGYQWDSTRDSGGGGGQLGTLTSGSSDNAATQYENAFAALKSGDYGAAETGFKSFIQNNPKHVLAGNAKYWLGETYYVRGDFSTAARVFAEAYQQYPKSSKAPDNLLKLGMSLASLNKKDDACVALGQVETQYSTGAGPVLNRAKQEMKRLGC